MYLITKYIKMLNLDSNSDISREISNSNLVIVKSESRAPGISIPVKESEIKLQKNNICSNCIIMLFYFIGFIFTFAIIYSFSIVQIVYASIYKNSVCNSPINLSMSTWLKVSGSVELTTITFFLICLILKTKGLMMCVLGISQIFSLTWLITGSILFWRDCPNIQPSDLNNLMWATLMIKYTLIFISCCYGKLKN